MFHLIIKNCQRYYGIRNYNYVLFVVWFENKHFSVILKCPTESNNLCIWWLFINRLNVQTASLQPLKRAVELAWASKKECQFPGRARTWQEPEESRQSISQEQPEGMYVQKTEVQMEYDHQLKKGTGNWTKVSLLRSDLFQDVYNSDHQKYIHVK